METKEPILLILDVDETLIHATEKKLTIPHDFEYADYFVYKRPFLNEFLELANQHFKLAIWSSADDTYVNAIVETIRPEHINFEFVWARSRCTVRRDYDLDRYVREKRLKKIKKQDFTLERALIVDDSPEKTKDNFGNAIYINPFEGNLADNELKKLTKFLIKIKDVDNVRTFEKRGWRNTIDTQ